MEDGKAGQTGMRPMFEENGSKQEMGKRGAGTLNKQIPAEHTIIQVKNGTTALQ